MKIVIHRGTHQIGGISTEIKTEKARIIIDMGDELSCDPNFVSAPLEIDGVTNANGICDGVLLTHYHGDHIGQIERIEDNIPIYTGTLAKEIILKSAAHQNSANGLFLQRAKKIKTFNGGEKLYFNDICITPYSIDHSACDSYMFLIEGEGKRVLYTGDIRLHGFRGKAIPKILHKIGKIDALITEGTTLSRSNSAYLTEMDLQQQVKEYMQKYKYVHILCSSTNLERICAFSKAVPRGKYFVCDKYQSELIELVEKHWCKFSSLYSNVKKTVYGDNILKKLQERGFLMLVRDNKKFRDIVGKFDPQKSIILYSMWDGYRTKPNSTIPDFLNLVGNWEHLHTSGHAMKEDIIKMINVINPSAIIPMHTDSPELLISIVPNANVLVANDGEEVLI